jgi:16S rRNA (cytosine967-C5)-methyltransferase
MCQTARVHRVLCGQALQKAYNLNFMPVSPARAAAFDILLRVERDAAYTSELLHSARYGQLSIADHALATELVMGVLRWRSRLDDEIAETSSQPISRLDLEILIALRLALYQLRWLDRIPPRAAIHESVELVKRARKRSAAPFVNAVLRKLAASAQSKPGAHQADEPAPSPEALSRDCAHPLWLVERWAGEYGIAAAQRICQYNQSIPSTTIRLRDLEVEPQLHAEGIQFGPGALLASARRVHAGDITRSQAFGEGQVVIQDEASQLVAALLGRGSCILDCCAAPGGKTLATSDRNPNANITAVELHPHRARELQAMLLSKNNAPRRARSRNINVLVADTRALPSNSSFDHVLADVPCSGTGTLARNPEIKWRLNLADLLDLQARQFAILRSALTYVAPGGRLIYSTCSLEKEENEDVVDQALAGNASFRLLDCRTELARLKEESELTAPDPFSLTRGPYLRTIPGIHPCDGFFAAILERVSK